MIYLEEPEGFEKRFDVVSCFMEDEEGHILLLQRHDHKPQGGTWGVPAGKVGKGERLLEAIIREIVEETGYEVSPEHVHHSHTVYVTHDGYSFPYHMYKTRLNEPLTIILEESAHKDFRWVTPLEALTMNLIPDEAPCIELCYGITAEKSILST